MIIVPIVFKDKWNDFVIKLSGMDEWVNDYKCMKNKLAN